MTNKPNGDVPYRGEDCQGSQEFDNGVVGIRVPGATVFWGNGGDDDVQPVGDVITGDVGVLDVIRLERGEERVTEVVCFVGGKKREGEVERFEDLLEFAGLRVRLDHRDEGKGEKRGEVVY